MELLAPLPPENVGGLLTFILDVTDRQGTGDLAHSKRAP